MAAAWPSAITWRSKAFRPPFWPLGRSFRCGLPPCLRRALRTNTTKINYSDAAFYGPPQPGWSLPALAQSTCESVTTRAPSISKPDTPQPYASFTTFLVRSPEIDDFETFDDSLVAFSNLETSLLQSDLDFWNLEFPITETLGPVIEPSDSLPLFPRDPAIEQTVEELLEIAGEAPSQRDGPSLISTVSSFAPTPSPTSSPSPSIRCSWPTCEKVFKNRSDYNHHCRYHNLPFQCLSCPLRQATKRELDRHVNSVHILTEKYFCTVSTCGRSLNKKGKPFSRKDGCRKHMRRRHRTMDDQVVDCDMDEETKIIRRQKKEARRVAG